MSYGLTISEVDVSDQVSLISLERNYDGSAKLMFRWDGDWRSPPWDADEVVVLRDEAPFIPYILFTGLLDVPRPLASDRAYPGVEYTALDLGRALAGPTVLAGDGSATVKIPAGTLASALAAYLARVTDALAAYGVATTFAYVGGANAITTLPITLEAVSIDGGFRRIAAAAPGVRVLLLPGQNDDPPKYTFVNVFAAATYDLVIDATRVPELNIQQTLDGCCGAVKTLQGITQGQAEVALDVSHDLVPAWDPAVEYRWTWSAAMTLNATGTPVEPDLSKVYRLFSFEAFTGDLDETCQMVALVETSGDDANPQWKRAAIVAVDWTAKTLLLNLPAIRAGSTPRVQGRSRAAPAKLRHSQKGAAGAPIIIASQRWPTTGFSGRAYTLAPITCGFEKVITIPSGVDGETYVQDAHAALSEPVVNGSIPIAGALPAALWNLGKRLNVKTTSHGNTGYEALAAPITGITVNFAAGGTATINLESDRSQLLRGGA